LILAIMPWPAQGQIVTGSGQLGPIKDLADIPLNRPDGLDRIQQRRDTFFPTLLGLTGGPGLKVIQTRHFAIYFSSAEHTARRIAQFADDVFDQIASYYPTTLDRYTPMHVVVSDGSDVQGNAFADPTSNYIMFWASPFDIEARGSSDWIRNVFTHELTHLITHKAAHRSWPFQLGLLSTSQSNNNPDFIFTLPLYHEAMPQWYSEGVAQYESMKYGGDSWDTHRDMLLRMATLEDDLLSYTAMGVFGKDSYHSEMVYNHGFALLRYVDERFGAQAVRAMTEERPLINFKSSVKKATGVSANRLYDDWTTHLDSLYRPKEQAVEQDGLREGDVLHDNGSMDYHPLYSPDGSKLALLSNDGADYSGLTRLKIKDLSTGQTKEVDRYVSHRFSWTPDGLGLVYVRSHNQFWDLHRYDVETGKSRRLTVGLRGKDPDVSPDGKRIAYIHHTDGNHTLAVVDSDGANPRFLTAYNDGTLLFSPRWSPDGTRIAFSIFRGEDRDVAVISGEAQAFLDKEGMKKRVYARKDANWPAFTTEKPDTADAFPDSAAYAGNAQFQALIHSAADERDPAWLPDGKGLLFSSDRTGIFNIYSHDLETGAEEQVTNVIGGAFVPASSPDGKEVAYAGYHSANYNLYRIPLATATGVASSEPVERDYLSIYTGDDIDDMFAVGRGSPGLTTKNFGFIPYVLLGPTFIGNRFGLDQFSFGGQFAFGELLGSDLLSTSVTLGKNLRKGLDLNSELSVFYQRSLRTLMSTENYYRPSVFMGFSREVINSVVERREPPLGPLVKQTDSLMNPILTVLDSQQVLVPNTTQELNLTLIRDETFKDVFSTFSTGLNIGLGANQGLSFAFSHRRFSENMKVKEIVLDSTRVFQGTTEITDQLPRGGQTQILFQDGTSLPILQDERVLTNDFFYKDLRFFKSNDLAATWRYVSLVPAKDMALNLRGGRAFTLRFRRINATVTDSLAFSPDANLDNIPDPTAADASPPPFRADNVSLGLNEYVASWNEFIPGPGRSSLNVAALVAYKDLPIKGVQQTGGTFEGVYYYPLRYYLGGLGTLAGYPYFSLSGGKIFLGRASFTFPIVEHANAELPPLFFDKIYGSFFIETGAASNFESLSAWWNSGNRLNRQAFLTDFGFELRMQMFSHYWLPMNGFVQVAIPMRDEIRDRNGSIDPATNEVVKFPVDNWRLYFGFSI